MARDPFEEIRKFQKEMNRRFNRFMESFTAQGDVFKEPLIDLAEGKKNLVATLELPGVNKEDIELNITNDSLEVKVEKKEEEQEEGEEDGIGFLRSERSYKGFYRSIALPYQVKVDKVRASYENGVLKITMPKEKSRKTRKVDIE